MYQIGEYIVYGTNGVCLVTDVGPSPFDKKDTRTYYVLKPISGPVASVIYTPVDNDRIPMRPLMTAQEGQQLLSHICTIEGLAIPNEKLRREAYRAAIITGAPESYVAVIKTIGNRRASFAGTQRRLPEFEIEYDSIARRHLYTELSLVLERSLAEMEEAVRGALDAECAI